MLKPIVIASALVAGVSSSAAADECLLGIGGFTVDLAQQVHAVKAGLNYRF
jgi:hypothetical protein